MATTVPVIKNSLVKTGPGKVLWAPQGSALPTFVASAPTAGQFAAVGGKFTGSFPAAWLEMGPTDAGLEIAESLSQEPVTVEESFVPVRYESTEQELTLSLALAHISKQNIKLSRRGGTFSAVQAGTGPTYGDKIEKYAPAAVGAEESIMIAHLNSTNDRIYIAYVCFQSGAVTQSYKKGADKLVLNLEYRVGVPDPAVATDPYNEWYAGDAQWNLVASA